MEIHHLDVFSRLYFERRWEASTSNLPWSCRWIAVLGWLRWELQGKPKCDLLWLFKNAAETADRWFLLDRKENEIWNCNIMFERCWMLLNPKFWCEDEMSGKRRQAGSWSSLNGSLGWLFVVYLFYFIFKWLV
jgi:hypothetical protein